MYIFLSVVIVLIAIFLAFIVTIQNSKGGGLASGFASSNQIMGVRKTTDILEKLTWGLTGAMVVLCIISARYAPRTENVRENSSIEEFVNETPVPVPADQLPFGDTPAANEEPVTNTPAEAPAETPAEPTPAQ